MDDQLGPREKRFFGAGFRRVSYGHTGVRVERVAGPVNDTRVSSRLSVRYPGDWSKKGGAHELPPHFSTIDGLLIAAELSELCIADVESAGVAETGAAWLRNVRISAGGEPQEDLGRIDARAVRRSCAALPDAPGWSVSVVDSTIGTMRVRCEVVHPTTAYTPGVHTCATPDDLLGPAGGRYFAEGFRSRGQEIRDVAVDPGSLRAEAVLALSDDGPSVRPGGGLEADYQPSVTMVDAFVTALQLAQVMLYDLDGMRRADSNTLWMRQTTMSAVRPDRPAGDGVRVDTAVSEPNLLRMGGAVWRTADIVGDLGGVRVSCAVTHRLPDS
ncbi:AvrD family protein [Nocardiopsis tropica]|uniref:AvrD family protein n=1 Tax=Nocardiopsis tropica TaxID=109330 RepID=A0ABU7KIP5_9ACTN|nr:AvrD family protein [Nocardiopsis umidischolae]MEE2049175.1 AvrD family protein [Nocardiopsis umidischolae]